MSKKVLTKGELLDRWSRIEEEDNDDNAFSDPLKRRRFCRLKEQWFADAFNFLSYLPEENHIWCNAYELMGPLLETFYNYFQEDEHSDSPLKLLWKRISKEMRFCTQCIYQHHQAQEMYTSEYELDLIGPLLDVLHTLDEERISQHLKEINAKMLKKEYDPVQDNRDVVSVMFEVLTYPVLLDDQSLSTEFQTFIEAIDSSHELTLAGHQEYPGVYALLFLKSRRARGIGFRLAGNMGKLRKSSDLDPLQPLLKKYISNLETDAMPTDTSTSRPRVQLDRATVWLGIKALLGFLEPRAFEEGILDRYPIFLSIVLNHISDDSAEFSHAVICLRLLFEMLGCKLWLRSAFSPSVMRNTLLGQCFHTRNEKSHKEIFDLFFPFLQSLEALQDGEHEKQRRHFIYFLLHQVTVSSNFSPLMRKKACQLANLIVLRGYTMDPPSPPFEYGHMWGPSLVSALKDGSLHSSLRQPAFDLIQTIIISDASSLITSLLQNSKKATSIDFNSEEDDEENLLDHENKDDCWKVFTMQSRITSRVYETWMCIPMLWLDVLVEIDPFTLPTSFAKAVFWAFSRFSMVESENSKEVSVSIDSEISHLIGWKVPSGYDDESKNSILIEKTCLLLLKTLKRLIMLYIVKMEQCGITKQWMWEPMMGDSLILLLVDPNDYARQVGRHVLEQVSVTRGLTLGLQFLSSCPFSLSALFLGLRHALKLIQLDCVLSKFQHLHHFFFVLCKLLKEGHSFPKIGVNNSETSKFSTQGGFLKPPEPSNSLDNVNKPSSAVGPAMWEKFNYLISELAWISIKKCLAQGKTFIDNKVSQMTCIRLLEVLPHVFERVCGTRNEISETIIDLRWLYDLIEWGKSSLTVVIRYWKQALVSLLGIFKVLFGRNADSAINSIEKLISSDDLAVDEIVQKIGHLSVTLSGIDGFAPKKSNLSSELLSDFLESNHARSLENKVAKIHDLDPVVVEDKDNLVILSDDETEPEPNQITLDEPPVSKSEIVDLLPKDDDITMVELETPSVPHQKGVSESDVTDITDITDSSRIVDKKVSDRHISIKSVEKSTKLGANLNKSISKSIPEQKSASDKGLAIKNVIIKKPLVKDVKWDTEDDDSWEFSFFKSSKPQQSKPSALIPKRQIIQLDLPVKNTSGSLKPDTGVKRFKPPRLDDWFKPILELNFFTTVGLSSTNDETKINKNTTMFKEVPVSFISPEEYIEIFRPLVLEEFKAQLMSSYQEMASPDEIFGGKLSVMSIERVDDFHIVRCVHDDSGTSGSVSLSENDLVLLTRQPLKSFEQSSSHEVHIIGKVDRREKDDKRKSCMLVIRIYLQNGCSRMNRAHKFLAERSKWCVSRLMNITPQLREFQALSSIKGIPLLPIILNPVKSPSGKNEFKRGYLSKLAQPLQRVLESSFNDSQLQAIGAAIGTFNLKKNFDLSLIQGPPGTGKTRTIVAILSSLLAFPQNRDKNRSLHNSSNTNVRPQISQSAAIARAWQDAALAKQMVNESKKDENTPRSRKRILICAQSNAAVDEIVSRISTEGLFANDGESFKPYLVRVGNPKTIHPNSLPFFIDTLVDRKLSEQKQNVMDEKNDNTPDSLTMVRSKLEKLVDQIRSYEAKRANLSEDDENSKKSYSELEVKLRILYEKKKVVYKELSSAQAKERKASEESRSLRYKLRKDILKEAELVVTTLSGCGGDLYGVCSESMSSHKFCTSPEDSLFDAVVIDEAAQALEPATLIPLQLLKSLGTRCIMVGDPKQLPATVLSNTASKYLFQCSMFERLQRAGHPVIMLTHQYRMHPEICKFPSLHFYESKLLNGDDMSSKCAAFHETQGLGPYVFFDIMDGKELHGKNAGALSLYNDSEADAAVEVLRFFKKRYPSEFSSRKIGVITPYKCQLSLLRSRFSNAFGSSIASEMEFNTVDGFQGREVDILILSTVRAAETPRSNSKSIGFVADVRRMNVALTRAKLSLWILGNAKTLQGNPNWGALLRDAKERNLVISVNKPYTSIFEHGFRRNTITQKSSKDTTEQRRRDLVSSGVRGDSLTNNHGRGAHANAHHSLKDTSQRRRDSISNGANDDSLNRATHKSSKDTTSQRRRDSVSSGVHDDSLTNNRDRGSSVSRDSKRKVRDESNESVVKSIDRKGKGQEDNLERKQESVKKSKVEKEEGEDGKKASSYQVELPKDKIAKRKQQRDAVEALLSSSLISSNKTESSKKSKSTKKTLSPNRSIKPSMPKKGAIDDQTQIPRRRKF